MRTRVAFALSEIFVVNVASITASWPLFGAAGFMDLLAEHALGDYRSLLAAVSRNLSMGCMLTFAAAASEDPRTGRHPDENYAREVMQLFSIGLLQLHPDGTPRLEGGAPVETYTNADVQGLARVFTGWDLDGPEADVEFHRRPMKLDPALHSMAEKRFLASSFRPARGFAVAGAGHGRDLGPSQRRPFIGAQLIQRLVASNPSPAYVARVAAVFADDGLGARGNLKAVTRAVLLDPEARFPTWPRPIGARCANPSCASPAGRGLRRASSNGAWAMPDTSDNTIRLAQSPMRAPSVFNFFRPRYTPAATELARQAAAPELQITDETSIAGYLNFLAIYADRGWEDLQTDYAAELALAGDPDALVAHVALLLAGDAFSEATARRIATALRDIPPERPRDRARAAIVLVAASPEYLVQK